MPSGVRVTPAQASLMPRIVTPNVEPAIPPRSATPVVGTSRASRSQSIRADDSAVRYVYLGDGSSKQNSLSLTATDLVLDRVYIHGIRRRSTSRCVALNSARTAVMNSYLSECHARASTRRRSRAGTAGPVQDREQHADGRGENVMFGGADPRYPNLIPCDIDIRGNYL